MGAGLLGEDLLRAQRHADGRLGGQPKRLIQRVGMQTLASAQDTGHRLVGDSDDVVQRLLLGQRAPGGLHVRPHEQRARIPGGIAIAHDRGPHAPGGA